MRIGTSTRLFLFRILDSAKAQNQRKRNEIETK